MHVKTPEVRSVRDTVAPRAQPPYALGWMRQADDDRAARAERIRRLKAEQPGLTWQAIADHVGVGVRAAQTWPKSGAISYANAKKLAELFPGVDADYVLRGPPDPDAPLTQLDRIEQKVDELRVEVRALTAIFRPLAAADSQADPGQAVQQFLDWTQQLVDDARRKSHEVEDSERDTA